MVALPQRQPVLWIHGASIYGVIEPRIGLRSRYLAAAGAAAGVEGGEVGDTLNEVITLSGVRILIGEW
eukprot:COSAG01_NODE_768_length_13739_cov_6.271334_16_plen_68_part_00